MARLASRRYGKYGHGYTLDGEKVPGVTTVLNALPKALTQWAADQAANHAVEHWAELGELPLTKRLDRIRFAHRDTVKAAGMRGTEIHNLGEKVAHDEEVVVPDEHRQPVEAYARFLDAFDVEAIATETPVVNTSSKYAGRADMTANLTTRELGRHRALVDLKTGKDIYAEVALQLAGYRGCDIWQPDGPDSEEPLPAVDAVYVAHIMPDDVRLLPIKVGPADFRQFLYVLETHKWLERHGYKGDEPLVGDQLVPPDLNLIREEPA